MTYLDRLLQIKANLFLMSIDYFGILKFSGDPGDLRALPSNFIKCYFDNRWYEECLLEYEDEDVKLYPVTPAEILESYRVFKDDYENATKELGREPYTFNELLDYIGIPF
jgi:hypothetical protein